MVHERTYVYVCLDDREVRTTKLVLRIVFPYKDVLSSAICMHKYMIFQIMRWKIRMNGIHTPYGIIESMIHLCRRKSLKLVLKVRFGIIEATIPFWYHGVNDIFLVSSSQQYPFGIVELRIPIWYCRLDYTFLISLSRLYPSGIVESTIRFWYPRLDDTFLF